MSQEPTHEWLPLYLRDHMAGARAGVNLFDRVARGHSHQRVRTEIARIRDEVEQDCQALGVIMADLEVRQVSVSMALGVLGEFAGRLKPNGAFLKRTAGADVLELEALVAAVQTKARLWETLLAVSDTQTSLDAEKLHRLQARADKQRETITELHIQVVRTLSTQ